MVAFPVSVSTRERYGALHAGFEIRIGDGPLTLVGPNNSGKSSILNLAFNQFARTSGYERVAFIPSDRQTLAQSTQPGVRTLENWNSELVSASNDNPLPYFDWPEPSRGELSRLLLTHSNFLNQAARLNELLPSMELPPLTIGNGQSVQFFTIAGGAQGTGLRSSLPILCALTDEKLEAVFIDEPENGLEPRLQKRLSALLKAWASPGRLVMLATHSHLFLNRDEPSKNIRLGRGQGDQVTADPCINEVDLRDVTFRLLGSSLEDLFFPGNFLIVEGASDQVICEKALELLGAPKGLVKVYSATGITEAPHALQGIVRTLKPLVMDSPYKTRVVVLLDQPQAQHHKHTEEIKKAIGDRLFPLTEASIEAAIPERVYNQAALSKESELQKIEAAHGNYPEERRLKQALSKQLAACLTAEDLNQTPVLREAVSRAIEEARG